MIFFLYFEWNGDWPPRKLSFDISLYHWYIIYGLFFPRTIYKDFLSCTTTLIAFMKLTPPFVVIYTGNQSILSHSSIFISCVRFGNNSR